MSRGAADVAAPHENAGEPTLTVHAAAQPAAIVSKSLDRMAGGESRIALGAADNQGDTSDIHMELDLAGSTGLISDQPSSSVSIDTDTVISELKTQFKALAEVAVLAQANQMPGGAMPFSMSTKS